MPEQGSNGPPGAGPQAPETSLAAMPSDAEVLDALATDALIDLYFEASEPAERDAVFARLRQKDDLESQTFFVAMLAHDEDVFLRMAAAAELLRRGSPEAREVLVQALYDGNDEEIFGEAMNALVAAEGAGIFPNLQTIFDEPDRDLSERLAAMQGMERADPVAALEAFEAALAEMPATRPLDLSLVEAMLGCFVRLDAARGLVAFTQLGERVVPQKTAQKGFSPPELQATVEDEDAAEDVFSTLEAARSVLRAALPAP